MKFMPCEMDKNRRLSTFFWTCFCFLKGPGGEEKGRFGTGMLRRSNWNRNEGLIFAHSPMVF